MNKFERIQNVKKLGLNTEDCILITKIEQLNNNSFIDSFNQFSIRTFFADGNEIKKTPHLAVVDKKDLIIESEKLLRQGLHLIIKDCIDPKDCIFCGAALKTKESIIIEVAYGQRTVRDITHRNIIEDRRICDATPSGNSYYFPYKYSEDDKKLSQLMQCFMKFHDSPLIDVIFEFSYYNKPIGWKKEQFICWEITDSAQKPRYDKFLWSRYE